MRELKILGKMGYAYDYEHHPLRSLKYLEETGMAEIVLSERTARGISRTWSLTERGLAEYRKVEPLTVSGQHG